MKSVELRSVRRVLVALFVLCVATSLTPWFQRFFVMLTARRSASIDTLAEVLWELERVAHMGVLPVHATLWGALAWLLARRVPSEARGSFVALIAPIAASVACVRVLIAAVIGMTTAPTDAPMAREVLWAIDGLLRDAVLASIALACLRFGSRRRSSAVGLATVALCAAGDLMLTVVGAREIPDVLQSMLHIASKWGTVGAWVALAIGLGGVWTTNRAVAPAVIDPDTFR